MGMEVVLEDVGDDNMMICRNHPIKNTSTPGGICAFCLQEKLGKLVSSSFNVSIFPPASLSSSPSLRSEVDDNKNDTFALHSRRGKGLAFVLAESEKGKKKKDISLMSVSDSASIVYKRSKSATRSSSRKHGMQFLDGDGVDYSNHKKGFWSFLYSSSKHVTLKKKERSNKDSVLVASSSSIEKQEDFVVEGNDGHGFDQNAEFDRKVSRSKSVGCGSRGVSGEFLERISSGLGDCTLRRVESQRESNANKQRNDELDCIKERVKCGGIFGGFGITSSSSSYWISSLASPIRAFSSKPSSHGKREALNKDAAPNLAAIPSLLAVRT